MKFVEQSVEILNQPTTMVEALKTIEMAGRTCRQAGDSLSEDSYKKFFNMLVKTGHTSVLEHGTVYLTLDENEYINSELSYLEYDPYSRVVRHCVDTINDNPSESLGKEKILITTNFRVIVERNLLGEVIKHDCVMPTKSHPKRVTARVVTSIGIANEIVRHRSLSFTQESTRYCMYSKEKFGDGIVFIEPSMFDMEFYKDHYGLPPEAPDRPSENDVCNSAIYTFVSQLYSAECAYKKLAEIGWKTEDCARVLPKETKTELYITGFVDDWHKFFLLRAFEQTGKVHKDMYVLANMLFREFKEKKYLV